MSGWHQATSETKKWGVCVRNHSGDACAHNVSSSNDLNTKSNRSEWHLETKVSENDSESFEQPHEDEIDEERDALIASFKEHLKRNKVEASDSTQKERPITAEHHSHLGSIQSELSIEEKRDQELTYVEKIHTNSNSGKIDLTDCALVDKNNENMTKYDHRRDPSVTVSSGKNTAKHAVNYKKAYLFLYNLTMFIMFLMVHLILSIETLGRKIDDDSVQGAAFIIKLLTYTQLLESIHPILGLVPGGPFMPFLQVIGRLLVNHFLSESEIRVNSFPYAHHLFIVWSSIEIFRYSFYALRVFNVEIYLITWARYTLFMPLYPIGGFCEAQIVMATVRHLEKTGAYTIDLPNSANFSFSLPLFLRFYTFALLWPSIFYLMTYMWTQRRKQLKNKVD